MSRVIPGASTGGIFGLGARSGAAAPAGGGAGAPGGGAGAPGGGAAPAGGGTAPAGGAGAPSSRPSSSGGGGGASGAAMPARPGVDSSSLDRTGGSPGAPPSTQVASAGGMSEDDIKKMIIKHEGIRNRPYKDSLGLWTVGVGHLIGDGKSLPPEWNREFSNEEVMKMFNDDYASHRLAAQRKPSFDKLNTKGQAALTDLTFNMGNSWIDKWPMLKKQLPVV